MYKVFLEGSIDRQSFEFVNEDDAMQFASMAMRFGKFQDFHYETGADGDPYESVKVEDPPRALRVSMMEVED